MTELDPSVAAWRKSSRSTAEHNCVETARLADRIGVRDSTTPETGHLTLTPSAWTFLTTRIKAGELDL
ncbi:DUF397 domain-containing protein [Actinomadura craniellae]|uniref:DUF397 domain-containing protein n=1 Tax=Actinomadura craniellae TaxID=2231787 RepID=A0A365GW09_9ACTN|nr:DUF397 domain-containing protein [Actinomadura craniellae]RAY10996.1 DUF397 domain-containing protein [Actinomadura craniellae]